MQDPAIDQPVSGIRAFKGDTESDIWSQAGQLVGLGVYLTGDENLKADLVSDTSADAESEGFPIPEVKALDGPLTADQLSGMHLPIRQRLGRVAPPLLRDRSGLATPVLLSRYTNPLPAWVRDRLARFALGRSLPLRTAVMREQQAAWNTASQDYSPVAAVELMLTSLHHHALVVRVAAAASPAPHLEVHGQDDFELIQSVLASGCRSSSDTCRALAANALQRINSNHVELRRLTNQRDAPGGAVPAHTSILVHGTWARMEKWHRPPNGDFFKYIRADVSADLYDGYDFYRWTGTYDDGARIVAATDLRTWSTNHEVDAFDTVYAHSHGGTVVLDALEGDTRIRLLVLLSTPAVERSAAEWDRIFSNVGRIVTIRAKFDLVIFADRSRLRFRPEVREIPLKRWFTHSASHDPALWKKRQLGDEIIFEYSMTTDWPDGAS